MNITEYLKLSEVTEKKFPVMYSLSPLQAETLHHVLGLVGELRELEEALFENDIANVKEEIGDTLWYAAGLCRLYSVSENCIKDCVEYLKEHNGHGNIVNSLGFLYHHLVDMYKREFVYGKYYSFSQWNSLACEVFATVVVNCEVKYPKNYSKNTLPFTVEDVMETNIKKLELRFGDKFDAYRALNRNLDAEREILDDSMES